MHPFIFWSTSPGKLIPGLGTPLIRKPPADAALAVPERFHRCFSAFSGRCHESPWRTRHGTTRRRSVDERSIHEGIRRRSARRSAAATAC